MVKALTRKKATKATKGTKATKAKKGKIMIKSKAKKVVAKMKKRVMVKKVTKKVTKKLVKKVTMKAKKAVQAKAPPSLKLRRAGKAPVMAGQLGKVVHYYDKIGVAIVELTGTVTVGDLLTFKRGEREFTQPVSSMQIDHQSVEKAGKGKVIGVKVVQVADPGTIVLPG